MAAQSPPPHSPPAVLAVPRFRTKQEHDSLLEKEEFDAEEHIGVELWGWALLLATFALFVVALLCAVVSKVLPHTNSTLFDALKDDWYYCFLVPLTIPMTFIFIYFNWLSMKFFRHN